PDCRAGNDPGACGHLRLLPRRGPRPRPLSQGTTRGAPHHDLVCAGEVPAPCCAPDCPNTPARRVDSGDCRTPRTGRVRAVLAEGWRVPERKRGTIFTT